IAITGHRDHRWLNVTIDDDGPGIPAHLREDVFKPFLRLDDARNQDEGGTGLGLAIARDIARSHGGDIMLGDSPLGGLPATVRVRVELRPAPKHPQVSVSEAATRAGVCYIRAMTERGYTLFDTAIGRCGIAWTKRGIVATCLPETDERRTRARLARRCPGG